MGNNKYNKYRGFGMSATFSTIRIGDILRHPYYGDAISVTDRVEGPDIPSRVFLFTKREVTFYAGEFDLLGFEKNEPAAPEDTLPAKRYRRLPTYKKKDQQAPEPEPTAHAHA